MLNPTFQLAPMTTLLTLVLPMLLSPAGTAATQVSAFPERWSQSLGPGFSRPLVAGEQVLVTHRPLPTSPDGSKASATDTILAAFDLATGEPGWRARFADPARAGQEDYGGGKGPHARPLVHRGVALALGFGGGLHAFDAKTGAARWSLDLVEERGAQPVQFGFAAGPVPLGEHVLISAGGEQGGVVALDPLTGEEVWASEPFEISYVTPVVAGSETDRWILCVGRDRTYCLEPKDGTTRWSQPHKRPELTNFAMVHAVGAGALVSGQGNRGLVRIDPPVADGEAGERWWTRGAQFSHGRTLLDAGLVFGSTGSQLCCVDAEDGRLVFRQRGFGECSLVPAGPFTALQTEEGELLAVRLFADRIEVHARRKLLAPKAWCAPVPIEGGLLCRDGERLVRVELPAAPGPATRPQEVIETGGERSPSGPFELSPAQLAFAAGRYTTQGEEPIELRVAGATWSVRLGAGPAQPATALSETRFRVPALEASAELLAGEGPVPTGLRWTVDGASRTARFEALDPAPWNSTARQRIVGTWTVAEGVAATVAAEGEALVATSTAYPDVRFRCTPDSPDRLWLDAVDAGYGIPRTLLVLPPEDRPAEIMIHQGSDTYLARR